jgi:Flp pilus assembly CpaF family ATPase
MNNDLHLHVTLLPTRADAHAALVAELTQRVRRELAADRLERRNRGQLEPSLQAEIELARDVINEERLRAPDQGAVAFELTLDEFDRIAESVIASVLGLGRLQPLLEDPEISDIHVRGAAPVWIKRRDGTRVAVEPVVDSDDELIELIRRAATRLVRNEQRFDAANPELNLQLPDGSRLFAAMSVSQHPSLVIRRHRFEISSLD